SALWTGERGQRDPRHHVSSAVNGECIRGRDRSWSESVFRRPCCFPFYFYQTSHGNPRLPASLRVSPRKNRPEKCVQIANDGTAHHQRAPVVLNRPRTESNFRLTPIFPLRALSHSILEMQFGCAMDKPARNGFQASNVDR